MDVRSRVAGLSPQAREALARRVAARLAEREAPAPAPAAVDAGVDVVVIGGGAAALTLALQLRRERPGTTVTVVEPHSYPVDEVTHTVGESTVEISAHYLRERLGLGDHLASAHIRKMGLRMFFSGHGNTDIAARMEVGGSRFVPQPTYQVDRGRLENELHRRCVAAGVTVVTGRVRAVGFAGDDGAQDTPHTVTVQRGDSVEDVTARWVVDASGRNRTVARRLDLRRSTGHHCNAAWLRIGTEIDVGAWSDDPAWRSRLVEGDRAMSTNHLMGDGYWVWLIRLGSGATSVGIVADPDRHPFDTFNTPTAARAWLATHEPQCAAVLDADEHLIRDFRVMKHYSHGAAQVYDGARRWCLTGDAAVFLDPLYSSGLDLVAIGNGLICDMVGRDLDGEDVTARAAVSDALYRSLTEMWLAVYEGQYPLMGSPTVMAAKVAWDIAFYWGFLGLLYVNDRYARVADEPSVIPQLEDMIAVSNRVQRFFREWAAIEAVDEDHARAHGFVDLYAPLEFMQRLHTSMRDLRGDDAGAGSDGPFEARFASQFDANAVLLRQVAGLLVDTVITRHAARFADDAAVRQVQQWQADPLLRTLRSVYRREQVGDPVSGEWIVPAAPAMA